MNVKLRPESMLFATPVKFALLFVDDAEQPELKEYGV
jgi:hypothetical protein